MTARLQSAGLARVTQLLAAASWWFQWGSGTAAAQSANVVTTTSTTEARAATTVTQQTVTIANDTLRLVATLTALGARAITELGTFDAVGTGSPPTGGNMDVYCDFPVVNLLTGDSITFTKNIQFT